MVDPRARVTFVLLPSLDDCPICSVPPMQTLYHDCGCQIVVPKVSHTFLCQLPCLAEGKAEAIPFATDYAFRFQKPGWKISNNGSDRSGFVMLWEGGHRPIAVSLVNTFPFPE